MAIAETKGINLDDLQQETEKLFALLKDRQTGMMTWNEFMHERLVALHALISPALTPAGLSAEASVEAENTYPLIVDYGRSVEDAVKLGRYGWASGDINTCNFPTKRKEREKTPDVAMELVHFNRVVSTDEALRELDRMGYRPAKLRELLAFGEKYPEVQREFPVVALGSSVWLNRFDERYFPCLDRIGSRRHLDLHRLEDNWLGLCRFAAVRE